MFFQDGSLGIVGGDANNNQNQVLPSPGVVSVPGGIINRYPWPLQVPSGSVQAPAGSAQAPAGTVRGPWAPLQYYSPSLLPSLYIVNGWLARNHQFPFMAAILNGNRQFCGGSLITEIHILTAAHCVAQ